MDVDKRDNANAIDHPEITLRDRFRSTEIWRRSNLIDIAKVLARRKWKWEVRYFVDRSKDRVKRRLSGNSSKNRQSILQIEDTRKNAVHWKIPTLSLGWTKI